MHTIIFNIVPQVSRWNYLAFSVSMCHSFNILKFLRKAAWSSSLPWSPWTCFSTVTGYIFDYDIVDVHFKASTKSSTTGWINSPYYAICHFKHTTKWALNVEHDLRTTQIQFWVQCFQLLTQQEANHMILHRLWSLHYNITLLLSRALTSNVSLPEQPFRDIASSPSPLMWPNNIQGSVEPFMS